MAADGSIIIQIDGDSKGLENAMQGLDGVVKKGVDGIVKSIAAVGAGLGVA